MQQLGVTVAKAQANFLLIVALYDDSGRYNNVDISDFIVSKMQDPLCARHRRRQRAGVRRAICDAHLARSLQAARLRAGAVRRACNAIQAQNAQVSAGQIGGQPAVPGQALNATVTAQSQLQTPEQFRNIILKTTTGRRGGASVAMWRGSSWAPIPTPSPA